MVPVAGDATNQQQNADASRKIMQGLFKDLGKQAMALEAILRVVCGKVDRMESWMTTISFGLSELDLKLRNIAHNIDGTSAVDEDASVAQPWAVPPPDDDVTGARAVPTITRKLGRNSKQVRVTGMAAAIIDKLAAQPKSAADKVNKKKKPATTSVADTLKKAAKKKKPPTLKQPAPATPEVVTLANVSPVGVDKADSTDSSPGSEPAMITEKPDPLQTTAIEPSTGFRANSRVAEDMENFDAPRAAANEDNQLHAPDGNQPGPVEVENIDLTNIYHEQANAVELDSLNSENSSRHSTPRVGDGASSSGSSVDSTPMQSSRAMEQADSENVHEVPTNYAQDSTPRSTASTAAFVVMPENEQAQSPPEEATDRHAEVMDKREVSEARKATADQDTSGFVGELSVHLPVLHASSPEPDITIPPLQPEQVLQVQSQENPTPPTVSEDATTQSTSIPVQPSPEPAQFITVDVSQTTEKEPVQRRRSSLLQRVLAMSEPALSPDQQQVKARRVPEAQPLHQPADVAVTTELHQPRSLESAPEPAITSHHGGSGDEGEAEEDDTFGGDSDNRASDDDNDDESASDSSSNSSSDNADEEVDGHEQSDITQTGSISGASTSSGNKRVSIAAGSTITRTMTALKKLKKANVLTREEEEELKQRAQDKWFKLKGHVKEKQKKEVANILLKRKKNVFTVSSRLELLEEKSKELFASIKQIGNDIKLKTDQTAHESLRRQVSDMQRSLQNIDVRLGKMMAQLTPEKIAELGKQLDALRSGISEEIESLHHVVDSNFVQLDAQITEQRNQLYTIQEDIPQQLAAQAQEFEHKLQALPDFGSAIESIRRSLRRKADLKMLKELEARLLGHTLEDEDCLVRCLSCHKEVVNLQQPDKDGEDEEVDGAGSGHANQLRKVNPGPSSAKIYRSNTPFNAEPSGVSNYIAANTKNAIPPAETKSPNAAVVDRRVDTGLPKASPISRLTITASSMPPSPDRPISAPAAALKKKHSTTIKARVASNKE